MSAPEKYSKPRTRMSWKVTRQIPPKSFGDGWIGEPFGSNNHLEIRRTPEFVTMTGQAVTTRLLIPYPHRINKVESQHTDAAGDVNTTALTQADFSRKKWSTPTTWFVLWSYDALVASDFEQSDLAGREFPAGEYRFITNTTEGHLMFYLVTIQILNKRGKEFLKR